MNHSKSFLSTLAILFTIAFVLLTGCGGGGGSGDNNTPPVANAGHDVNSIINALFALDGSASSDTDGDPLTYNWNIVSIPVGSGSTLSSPSSVSPTFTIDLTGTYTIRLVVDDGNDSSIEDTVTVTALPSISHIYDTGQKKCFNNSIEIACPNSGNTFYGQDAQYSTNPLRFVDSGATVTDNINGLMWQEVDDGMAYNWYQAMGIFDATFNPGSIDVCGSLTLGGFHDWRLPSRRELLSIVNNDFTADTDHFQSSAGSGYWTSTTEVPPPIGGSTLAWAVSEIHLWWLSKGGSGLALLTRCVRGPSWGQNSLVDNGDGTVTDNMSGLIWQQDDGGVARNWEDALAHCETLMLASSSDWRLPDIKELDSLVNINSSNETNLSAPSIDSTYFPTTQTSDYWASTTHSAQRINIASSVDFAFGFTQFVGSGKAGFLFSRCVR